NENADPSVQTDILSTLNKLIPEQTKYTHLEGNSDAHVQSTLVGHSIFLIIEEKRIQLGTWQGIFLCEFDGPRTREVWIQILK
ncbi:MAG TPA: secondary thiamine-phosphate synthase enzyme YjbQ, partial [bacterium]|nr:secondary thiamine-phosphate synthase enzyme YjbQ [bacterium]